MWASSKQNTKWLKKYIGLKNGIPSTSTIRRVLNAVEPKQFEKGNIITIDSTGCQIKIVEKIIKKKADYVISLKSNQGTLYNEVKEYYKDLKDVIPLIERDKHESVKVVRILDKGHGRIEERKYYYTTDIDWMVDAKKDWAGLAGIGMVYRKVIENESERIMNKMIISIIVPVYNSDPYLERLFQSLVQQTLQCFEIVVVDDGSTDGSEACIRRYHNVFGERLKYIYQQNRGVAAARNVGLRASSGEYIAFVDSDDYIKDNFCKRMLEEIADVDIVVCGVTVYKKDEIYEHDHVSHCFKESGFELAKDSLRKRKAAHVLWNKLYSRSVFDGFEFVEGYMFEDMYGCAIIALSAKQVSYIDEELYAYCRRDDSLSAHITDKHAYDLSYLMQKIVEVYRNNGVLCYMMEEVKLCLSGVIELICKLYIKDDISQTAFKSSVDKLLALKKQFKMLLQD